MLVALRGQFEEHIFYDAPRLFSGRGGGQCNLHQDELVKAAALLLRGVPRSA